MGDACEYLGMVYIVKTPDERPFQIFGTHKFIGSGPYRDGKDGSCIQWGTPFKAQLSQRFNHSRRHGSGESPHQKAAGDGQDDLIVQDTCGPYE
jgi:hypothetical protein